MKSWMICLSLFTCALVANASPTLVKSLSTSISESDCIKVKSSEYDAQSVKTDYEYMDSQCPGLGGYEVMVEGKDLRYSVALVYRGQRIQFAAPNELHKPATEKVEWRFEHNVNEATEMKALLFQLKLLDENSLASRTITYVVRLKGEKSCLLGQINDGTNALLEAQKLADDNKAKCLNETVVANK